MTPSGCYERLQRLLLLTNRLLVFRQRNNLYQPSAEKYRVNCRTPGWIRPHQLCGHQCKMKLFVLAFLSFVSVISAGFFRDASVAVISDLLSPHPATCEKPGDCGRAYQTCCAAFGAKGYPCGCHLVITFFGCFCAVWCVFLFGFVVFLCAFVLNCLCRLYACLFDSI